MHVHLTSFPLRLLFRTGEVNVHLTLSATFRSANLRARSISTLTLKHNIFAPNTTPNTKSDRLTQNGVQN